MSGFDDLQEAREQRERDAREAEIASHRGLAERVAEIMRDNLRLVSTGGEPCAECGEQIDYTFRVKPGCIEHCAGEIERLVFEAMANGDIGVLPRD